MSQEKPGPVPISRRSFLALAGGLPALLATGSLMGVGAGAKAAAVDESGPAKPLKKYPIGLELFSVRGELAKDPEHTLRSVAAMGYEVVEFFAPYTGWSLPYAKGIRSLMDDIGLRCLSTHNLIDSFTPGDGQAKAIELNQIFGSRYLVLATAPGSTQGLEGWKTLCGQLTAAVGQLKPHGLSAGYHNHQTEWSPLEGGPRIMDILAANTPAEFMLQLDVGTCVEAGADPVAWIRANPGRIRSVHLKDWAPGTAAANKGYRVLFGEGVAPWREITAAAESTGGVEFYLMEQEGSRFPELETAQRCLATWRALRKEV
jgi:sugar phosphate isomerase/epimerase